MKPTCEQCGQEAPCGTLLKFLGGVGENVKESLLEPAIQDILEGIGQRATSRSKQC